MHNCTSWRMESQSWSAGLGVSPSFRLQLLEPGEKTIKDILKVTTFKAEYEGLYSWNQYKLSRFALFYLNIWYCGYREFGRQNSCKLLQRVCERFHTWDSVEFLGGAFRDRGKARGVSSDPPTKGGLSFSLRISISQRRRFSHWEDTAWLHSPHAF